MECHALSHKLSRTAAAAIALTLAAPAAAFAAGEAAPGAKAAASGAGAVASGAGAVASGAAAAAGRGPAGDAAARPGAAKLLVVSLPRQARGGARLELRALRRLSAVTVTVNGRAVSLTALRRARQRTAISLGADDRLRFGANRVVVRATGFGGGRQLVRRTLQLRRGAPLVGVRVGGTAARAGAVAGRPAAPLRLDARSSRPSARGRLSYRWRVVAGPRRARARLIGATTARPRLVASHPGRYQLALTVREASRGKLARAAACGSSHPVGMAAGPIPRATTSSGQPVASAPLELLPAPARALETIAPVSTPRGQLPGGSAAPAADSAGAGCATQYVAVEVAPSAGPLGVAFDSRAVVGGRTGVRIGQSFYATPANARYAIFLDATTLGELGTQQLPPAVNAEQFADLIGAVYAVSHQVLIVLTGPDFTLVKRLNESDRTAVSNEGLTEGDGVDPPRAAGQLTGWLQRSIPLDSPTPAYRLIQPDRASIDTSSAASPTSNTIAVGGARYASELPAQATAGFQVLVLDPALRPQLGTPRAFATDGPDAAGQQAALANLLESAAATTAATVVVQSIGRPKPTAIGSVPAAQQIERLGGSEWLFLGLDGSGGYALVGTTPPLGAAANDEPAAEASSQWTDGGDSLEGLLRRRHDGAWYAALSDSLGADGLDFSLQQVAFQQPTPWPEQGDAGQTAALAWIGAQLDLPTSGGALCVQGGAPSVRAQYCNAALMRDPDALKDEIGDLAYAQTDAFTAEQFVTVRSRLRTELDQVSAVWNAIGTMQQPFALADGSTAIAAADVAAKVIESVRPPQQSPVSADLGLTAAILYVVAEVPEVGEAFGPVASVLDLASELTEQDDEPSPDREIEIAAGQAGAAVDRRLMTAYEALGDYGAVLVADAGKLSAAYRAVLGPWGQSSSAQSTQLAALRLGVRQWLFTAITPAAYSLVRIPGADPATARKEVECVHSSSPASWHPFGKADQRSLFFPLNDWGGSAPKADQLMGMLHGSFSNDGSRPVGEGLADDLFNDPSDVNDPGAGLVAPWFYDRAQWTIERPKMLQPSSPLVPGWCQAGRVG